jgi:teichuronic acid biosynthesis glycosyltransferase TuaC
MEDFELTCVAPMFPMRWFPESGAFLKNLADVMHEEGIPVQVVAPYSVGREVREKYRAGATAQVVQADYSVVRPRFVEMPLRLLGGSRIARRLNEGLFRTAVERGLSSCPRGVRVVYSHFWVGGYAVRKWCRTRSIPYVVELQESGIRGFLNPTGERRELCVLEDARGVVCVSKDNERFLGEVGISKRRPVKYLPNGFDARRFRPMDRTECRRKLGLPSECPIVIFAGHFIERKGPLRVLAALEKIGYAKGVFVGRGPQRPVGGHVLHAEPVLNSDLPVWLSAADVFVLPSLAEGLANVTVEAMACGLPLVVSDRPFNRDFLGESDAVFVDPESVSSIASGLACILESEARRRQLARSAQARACAFSLQERVRAIRVFISELLDRSTDRT